MGHKSPCFDSINPDIVEIKIPAFFDNYQRYLNIIIFKPQCNHRGFTGTIIATMWATSAKVFFIKLSCALLAACR